MFTGREGTWTTSATVAWVADPITHPLARLILSTIWASPPPVSQAERPRAPPKLE